MGGHCSTEVSCECEQPRDCLVASADALPLSPGGLPEKGTGPKLPLHALPPAQESLSAPRGKHKVPPIALPGPGLAFGGSPRLGARAVASSAPVMRVQVHPDLARLRGAWRVETGARAQVAVGVIADGFIRWDDKFFAPTATQLHRAGVEGFDVEMGLLGGMHHASYQEGPPARLHWSDGETWVRAQGGSRSSWHSERLDMVAAAEQRSIVRSLTKPTSEPAAAGAPEPAEGATPATPAAQTRPPEAHAGASPGSTATAPVAPEPAADDGSSTERAPWHGPGAAPCAKLKGIKPKSAGLDVRLAALAKARAPLEDDVLGAVKVVRSPEYAVLADCAARGQQCGFMKAAALLDKNALPSAAAEPPRKPGSPHAWLMEEAPAAALEPPDGSPPAAGPVGAAAPEAAARAAPDPPPCADQPAPCREAPPPKPAAPPELAPSLLPAGPVSRDSSAAEREMLRATTLEEVTIASGSDAESRMESLGELDPL